MSKAAIIRRFGGPEVISVEEVTLEKPGARQVVLRHQASAIHLADPLMREGLYYYKPELPAVLGIEGAGIIEELGPGVNDFKVGETVSYRFSLGSYSEKRVIDTHHLQKLPNEIDARVSVAIGTRGLTAQYLLRQLYPLKPEDIVLIHAAAGGMGGILTQWAKHLGVIVIGTVGSKEKVKVAELNGCDYVINYNQDNFADVVLDITNNKGVPVVYDSVGLSAYKNNLKVLAPRGWFINYGHSSGFLPSIDAMELNSKSLVFTKASLKDFNSTQEENNRMITEVNEMIIGGFIKANITHEYNLEEIGKAHEDISNRKTNGTVILTF